jgi:hypothetical protein
MRVVHVHVRRYLGEQGFELDRLIRGELAGVNFIVGRAIDAIRQ